MTTPAAPNHAVHTADDSPGGGGAVVFVGLLAGYGLVFAGLAWPWLREAHVAVPAGAPVDFRDQQIVLFVLEWMARAPGHPAALFDLPIHHPAPDQLTGSEHFATWQILFSPLYQWSGNALLAANLTVFVTYVLSAALMHALLRHLGATQTVAALGAVTFALGPLRLPAHLHSLQYANFLLAWIALTLSRLRDRPAIGRAAHFTLALLAGLFSSYYAAVMVLLVAGVWSAFEFARPVAGRRRFGLVATTCVLGCVVLLALASAPYFGRLEATQTGSASPSPEGLLVMQVVALHYLAMNGVLAGVLGLLGLLAFWDRGASRRIACRGLVVGLVGGVLMFGFAVHIAGVTIPMPWSLTTAFPMGFFRFPPRLVVILGFGLSLMAAAGVQMLARRAGPRWGTVLATTLIALTLLGRGGAVAGLELRVMPEQVRPIYEELGEIARQEGGGPLLELPIASPFSVRNPAAFVDAGSMVGATRHHLPLVGGFTGHTPPHRVAIEKVVRRLPEDQSFQLLVDMTHLRWILLRPQNDWQKRSARDQLLALPDTEVVLSRDGFDLLRVDRQPQDPLFFDRIADGFTAGETALGTPLTPIPESAATSRIVGTVPSSVQPGGQLRPELTVTNTGAATWPVLFSQWAGPDHRVGLRVRWRCLDRECPATEPAHLLLPWDVRPGASVRVRPLLTAPEAPGVYELQIRTEQQEGALFSEPENQPFVARVHVVS